MSLSLFYLLSFSLLLLHGNARSASLPSAATTVGVTYSVSNPTDPPSPESIVAAANSLRITAVRLPDPSPSLTRTFAYTNISLLLSIPNILVSALAANRSAALRWLYHHVLPFYPRSRVSIISVGNDVVDHRPDISHLLLPAIRNVHLALRDLGIHRIAVSSTFSFLNVMTTSFPPSAAQFLEPFASRVLHPLMQFLEDTNSSFLINIYPYNVYRLNCEIPIGFALFQEQPFNFRDDVVTGTRYWNLFDVMVDAVITAMAVSGHENIPVVVAETGWPSTGGDSVEMDATAYYAEIYLKGLVAHLKSGVGTPLRKEGVAQAYIYELVDKEVKKQPGPMRNWGIMYPNMTMKYDIQFSGEVLVSSSGNALLGIFLLLAVLMSLWNL